MAARISAFAVLEEPAVSPAVEALHAVSVIRGVYSAAVAGLREAQVVQPVEKAVYKVRAQQVTVDVVCLTAVVPVVPDMLVPVLVEPAEIAVPDMVTQQVEEPVKMRDRASELLHVQALLPATAYVLAWAFLLHEPA
jgi:hypothetical protein